MTEAVAVQAKPTTVTVRRELAELLLELLQRKLDCGPADFGSNMRRSDFIRAELAVLELQRVLR